MVFIILNVFDEGFGPDLCKKSETKTRGHDKFVIRKQFNQNFKKSSFSNRVVKMWNELPDNLVE